jgi:hypothetical protein
MKTEFVPYGIALALKEIGFDEDCISRYCLVTEWEEPTGEVLLQQCDCLVSDKNLIKAPLYQQAFRWFREKYNIDSWVQPFTSEKSNRVLYLPDESYSYFIFKDGVLVVDKVDFLEYEEAELDCLKKLIEIVKNQIQ